MKEDETMKRWLKAVVVCSVAVMVVAGMVSFANAGGGINWKTKIKNESDHPVTVYLTYNVAGSDRKETRIEKGSSHTFETGAKCPFKLSGWVYDVQVAAVDRCVNGLEGTGGVCSVVCSSTDWKIKKHTDGAFHFDKD
jgi:hypothetical protein